MKIAPIFDPEKRKDAPQAAQVDLHIIFLVGTVLWLALAIGFGIAYFCFTIHQREFIISLWGVGIGIAGLIWELYNRHIYRLLALMQQ